MICCETKLLPSVASCVLTRASALVAETVTVSETLPTASWMFASVGLATSATTPVTTAFLKPLASASTRYVPGGMRSKAKWPSSLDVWVRVVFVPGSIRLTVAPGTTLPCESVTVPRTEDVPVCAEAGVQKSARRRAQRSASAPLPEVVGLVIVPS